MTKFTTNFKKIKKKYISRKQNLIRMSSEREVFHGKWKQEQDFWILEMERTSEVLWLDSQNIRRWEDISFEETKGIGRLIRYNQVVKQVREGVLVVEDLAANARDVGLIPGLGRSPGEGNGNPLQDSCLGNPKNRGAWWARVHGVAESRTWLSAAHTENAQGLETQMP